MSVDEKFQAKGQWSVTLTDDTPRSVREQLGFGLIVITPTHADVESLADPDVYEGATATIGPDDITQRPILQDLARYAGPVLHVGRGDDRRLSGYGLAWFLGVGDKGPIIRTREASAPIDTDEVLHWLLPLHIRPGQTWAAPTQWRGTVERYQTARDALDHVFAYMGCEWRINADATMDAGPRFDVFGFAPRAVAVRNGAHDVDVRTLEVASLALAEDYGDWVSDTLIVGRGGSQDHATGEASRSSPYMGPHGDELRRTALVHDSRTEALNADAYASAVLSGMAETRRELSLSVGRYTISDDAYPGHVIAVYDPRAGAYDLGNEMVHGGRTIWPLHLRVVGVKWPITKGMGVYWTSRGQILDLTEYVQWESGDTSIEVGAMPRALTHRPEVAEAQRARTRGDELYPGGS